ncbi:MAG TPA: hypothetical protein VKT49_10965 [Bryobacteraceae bacterium]|nr:hypothetical protein [Bryobacteraceae bacterium]
MNNQDIKLPSTCGLSSLQRPKFSPGLLLEDDDLNAGVSYTQDLSRLLFRSLFGCGVICGLNVKVTPICAGKQWDITVTRGVALDCMGNPIWVPADLDITYDPGCDDFVSPLWVTVCYVEKCCRPKDVACSPDDTAQPKPTRVRAGYEIKLQAALPACACHCPTDDDNPAPKTLESCCGDNETTPAPATVARSKAAATPPAGGMPNICPCFNDHYLGICDCDCACTCVVIGKITNMTEQKSKKDTKKAERKSKKDTAQTDPNITVTTDMVRHIRPQLNGYLMCDAVQKKKESAARSLAEEIEEELTGPESAS